MPRTSRILLILLVALVPAAGRPGFAEQATATARLSSEARAKTEAAVAGFLKQTGTPGAAVAVVLGGQLVWSEGFGQADLENSVAATRDTLFRLGSVSKPLTATAILQLVERRKLDLDREVQTYCPDFPRKEWPITTREVLGHLGGIRHYNKDGQGDVPADSARHFGSTGEALTLFAKDPLVARPGTEFHYSTYGYTLIGCVLEGASREKYLDYMRTQLFKPAGMPVTQADDSFAVIAHRSRWYHKDEAGVLGNAGVLDSSYKIPGGGLISSADDMGHFVAAMLADKLVKRATRELLWTAQTTTDGKTTNYGLGWGLAHDQGLMLVAHSGGQQGTSTSILLAPEPNVAIVVLANLDDVDASGLSAEILKIVLAERAQR